MIAVSNERFENSDARIIHTFFDGWAVSFWTMPYSQMQYIRLLWISDLTCCDMLLFYEFTKEEAQW